MKRVAPYLLMVVGLYLTGSLTFGDGAMSIDLGVVKNTTEVHGISFPWHPLTPSPIPQPGFRVAIIEETADRDKLTPEQRAILTSVPLRQLLDTVCVKGPDGKTPEYRFFDKDADLTHETPLWQDVVKIQRDPAAPLWLIIGGRKGFNGPCPPTIAELMTLIQSHASAEK